MRIIYNPTDGAPIKGFIFKNVEADPHYPDGYEMPDGKFSNGLMQYEDGTAEEILERFEFLQEVSVEQAQKILDRPKDPEFKCEHPGCEFATHTKIALMGHQRSHKAQNGSSEPAVAINLIPVSGGKRVLSIAEKKKMLENGTGLSKEMRGEIANGTDADGVDWYGEGLTRDDFVGVKPFGKGHFGG